MEHIKTIVERICFAHELVTAFHAIESLKLLQLLSGFSLKSQFSKKAVKNNTISCQKNAIAWSSTYNKKINNFVNNLRFRNLPLRAILEMVVPKCWNYQKFYGKHPSSINLIKVVSLMDSF